MPRGSVDLVGFGYAAAVGLHRARLDAAAAEASTALAARGVRCLLLKGRVNADWLYPDARLPERYRDVDLLVAPSDFSAATKVLTALGYATSGPLPVDPELRALLHSQDWAREADAVDIDLHWRLPGADRDPLAVWRILVDRAAPISLGDVEVLTLDPVSRVVALCLHVTQRGAGEAKALDDLRRGLSVTSDSTWRAAFDLAGVLGAQPAMLAGLRSTAPGSAVADRLDLPAVSLPYRLSALDGVPRGTTRLLRLSEAKGWRARARLAARGLWPSAEAIGQIYAVSRLGRWGVPVARAWHLAIAPARLALAVIALRRARRDAGEAG